MPFENRAQAAQMLAGRLEEYRGRRPLVLAIPRGAVPMGKILADTLDGELDVVLARKLRAPQNPELAIGSIDETGAVYLDPNTRDWWDEQYLQGEKATQLETLRRRRQLYEPAASPIDAEGRVVIVLDDGVATGSTMIAALRAMRPRGSLRPLVWPPPKPCNSSIARPMKWSASRRRRCCTRSDITSATSRRCRTKMWWRRSRRHAGEECPASRGA